MGRFDQWKNFFSVGNTISQSSNTQPDDVLKTKSALAQTGDYKVPDFGITDIPDMGMIDGLKKFQQKNGLKVDGVMKPGGPTEAKIGETMANQGVSNTDLLEAAKTKPKVPKIDPLTGLPEVKMPKLKKPTANMWEQVAQQQKPKANPWFQSSKIKPVEDEFHSANTRTMDGLLQYSKNGSLPALYADSLKNGDEKAVHEYANFMQQLSDRKGDRVDEFHQEVISRLPENVKQVFAQLEMDVGGNEAQVGTNSEPQFSERIKAHSAENVQRGKNADEQSEKGQGDQVEEKKKGPLDGEVTPCSKNASMMEAARSGRDGAERQIRLIKTDRKRDEKALGRAEGDFHLAVAELGVSLATDVLTGAWKTILKALVSAGANTLGINKVKQAYTKYGEIRYRLKNYDSNLAPHERDFEKYKKRLADLYQERKKLGC
ncbi:hypothetical protein [Terasakiella sp.]|uniref:hypothetical protein n=1 Tax=Terasakiella sp. TaxID=2034861 RepID=UPI003AA87128